MLFFMDVLPAPCKAPWIALCAIQIKLCCLILGFVFHSPIQNFETSQNYISGKCKWETLWPERPLKPRETVKTAIDHAPSMGIRLASSTCLPLLPIHCYMTKCGGCTGIYRCSEFGIWVKGQPAVQSYRRTFWEIESVSVARCGCVACELAHMLNHVFDLHKIRVWCLCFINNILIYYLNKFIIPACIFIWLKDWNPFPVNYKLWFKLKLVKHLSLIQMLYLS